MPQDSRFLIRLTLTCAFLLCLLTHAARAVTVGGDNDWRPIDPAQLALTSPVVEKDADAEAIFWEVRVDDGGESDLATSNYLRIKIYTERGRESESKVELPYFGSTRIRDVAARTIKPSGEIVELKKEDIFDKTIVKAGGQKLRAKSFALPGVEPGAIIEYRWREVRSNATAQFTRLRFQRDIPVQSVTCYIKPAANLLDVRSMRFQPFHMQTPKFVKDKGGFYSATLTNVPAYREEPNMPPEDEVRSWMLLYYSTDDKQSPEAYWRDLGKRLYDSFKADFKANDEVKQKATEIIGDAQTPDDKLKRLYDFCRTQIKNTSDDALGLTADDRAKLKENKSPADTLKRAQGTGVNVAQLFGALAIAAGFETRPALLGDRNDVFFDPSFTTTYFLDFVTVAVKVGDGWRFFDPSEQYVSYGMLPWNMEAQQALVADPKGGFFVQTPLAAPAKSTEKRVAKLKLDNEGTLEGDVRVEYTGHLAAQKKEYNDDDSPAQREATLRDAVKARLSTAELSDIKIENVQDPDKPFAYAYHVRVPGYAQRTGKRLFLQPAYFEHGVAPQFANSDRRSAVYFHYPWAEDDKVEIELPAGFALDAPDAPTPFAANEISKYTVAMSVTKDNRTLIYRRQFFFGGQSQIVFKPAIYPALKQLFDELHKRDNHTITLKQSATVASTTTTTTTTN